MVEPPARTSPASGVVSWTSPRTGVVRGRRMKRRERGRRIVAIEMCREGELVAVVVVVMKLVGANLAATLTSGCSVENNCGPGRGRGPGGKDVD